MCEVVLLAPLFASLRGEPAAADLVAMKYEEIHCLSVRVLSPALFSLWA